MVLWFSGDVCAISTSGLRQSAESSGSSWGPSADPWSPVPSGSALSRSQPWDVPPTLSSSEPWGRTPALPTAPPTTDPWAQSSPHHILNTGADPWGASQETSNSPGKWKARGAGDGLEGLFPKGNRICMRKGAVCLGRGADHHWPFLSAHLPSAPPWPALGGTLTLDPFAKPPGSTETKEGLEYAQALPCSGKPSSPVGKQEAGRG